MNTTINKSPTEQRANPPPSTADPTSNLWIALKLPPANPLYQVRFARYLTHRTAWICHSAAK